MISQIFHMRMRRNKTKTQIKIFKDDDDDYDTDKDNSENGHYSRNYHQAHPKVCVLFLLGLLRHITILSISYCTRTYGIVWAP